MRLDHLLSKEEEVGVGLLLICQGQINRTVRRQKSLREETEFLPVWYLRVLQIRSERSEEDFLVAMRLGDTPVLIPNTMVKT